MCGDKIGCNWGSGEWGIRTQTGLSNHICGEILLDSYSIDSGSKQFFSPTDVSITLMLKCVNKYLCAISFLHLVDSAINVFSLMRSWINRVDSSLDRHRVCSVRLPSCSASLILCLWDCFRIRVCVYLSLGLSLNTPTTFFLWNTYFRKYHFLLFLWIK